MPLIVPHDPHWSPGLPGNPMVISPVSPSSSHSAQTLGLSGVTQFSFQIPTSSRPAFCSLPHVHLLSYLSKSWFLIHGFLGLWDSILKVDSDKASRMFWGPSSLSKKKKRIPDLKLHPVLSTWLFGDPSLKSQSIQVSWYQRYQKERFQLLKSFILDSYRPGFKS